jgi:DNA-binding LytR/AlgR family response regulator
MKWKCLVVDDEPQAREVIKAHIQQTPMLELSGECGHALDALAYLQGNSVDLLFLDIEMPKLSGIDLVKVLPSKPRIIFTTAHKDYAWDGFELGAVDFLLKPVSFERFLKSVQKMQTPQVVALAPEPLLDQFVFFRAERKMIKVFVQDILYVESLKDYVKVVLNNRQIITKQTISTIEEILPVNHFIRVHRSFMVNLNKVDSFDTHTLFVGTESIPVGPLYRLEVARRLTKVTR